MNDSVQRGSKRRDFLLQAAAGTLAASMIDRRRLAAEDVQRRAGDERFRIRALDRKYDLHRPRGCTLLAIEVAEWPGNEFGLWLPETVYLKGEIFWGNWHEDAHLRYTRDDRGRWITKRSFDGFRVESTLTPDPKNSCMWYRHTFHNSGSEVLHGLNTQTCFHLVNAPQFISLRGSRVWANLDGKWMTTDKVARDKSPDPRRVWFLRKGQRTERTIVPQSFPSAIMPEAAHHALMVAENFAGDGCVAIASRNFWKLFNNNDCILRCLHSESLPIETLEPGQSVHQDSVLVFFNGDRRATIEHYDKNIATKWPSDYFEGSRRERWTSRSWSETNGSM